ncbi:OmpW family outer membrane protein, partial [Escherichia coli]
SVSGWYMDTDTTAKYKSGVTTVKDSVRLDPWVFMFSAGYRF